MKLKKSLSLIMALSMLAGTTTMVQAEEPMQIDIASLYK